MYYRLSALCMILLATSICAQENQPPTEPPLSEEESARLLKSFQAADDENSQLIKTNSKSTNLYSRRGDARFYLGRFADAVADYDMMVELDPELDSSHWRRGIALFYAERYEDAAAQFERYHSFDQVDRENGIWRYLCQYKAYGRDKARQGLLKYEKDDREPFPAVYKLFAGTLIPEQVLTEITSAEISKVAREQRLFYAHLYIGLNYAVEGETKLAQKHLALATQNRWPRSAGYGPAYMWHVGRLHEELLRQKPKN